MKLNDDNNKSKLKIEITEEMKAELVEKMKEHIEKLEPPKDILYLVYTGKRRFNKKVTSNLVLEISGPPLGRPKKDPKEDLKTVYNNAVDRIEI